jgi:predicted nuclease with TOPRIM domain
MTETTVEYARVRIQELSTQVDELTSSLAKVRGERDVLEARIAEARKYLSEQYEDLEPHAQELADLLGIELETERDIEVTVSFTVTVVASPTQDPEDIAGDLMFEVSSGWGGADVVTSDYSIDSARWS